MDAGAGHVEVRIDLLGPLRLSVDGTEVDVPGPRRRAVLALLALAGGRLLTSDALIDAIWPDDPPDAGRQTLHSHISRLRRHLGPAAGRLRRSGSGYALELGPDELDLVVVRRLADEAHAALRDGEPSVALPLVEAALGMWRGEALAEFGDVPALVAERAGLAEVHARLRDDAVEARLRTGAPTAVADASSAVADDPLRERAVALLMRALAAEERIAEALEAGSAYRRRLADETGLDPGPGFSDLEQSIAAGAMSSRAPTPTTGEARGSVSREGQDGGGRTTPRPLARPTGPLVGRERDREQVGRLVEDHRCVTVAGPGGVGKTRLALEVAADLSELGADVAVVLLAEVTEPGQVLDACASALALRVSGDVTPEAVAWAIGERALVVVLDNCEHVVDECRGLVSTLLGQAPGVRVLATSRVTLHTDGEYVVRLQPLPLPREAADPDALAAQPSVRAFVEHARRRDRDFELTADNAAVVVDVVRRLDGLPLALELAASQLAVLPVDALLPRLDRVLDAGGGGRDQRQRTLRATLAWSFDLLGPDEQRLLLAIAPFPAGVELATLEQIAAEILGPGVDPLAPLGHLVDASLVVPVTGATARYSLLETVRAFLLERLGARGERAAAQARLVAHCLAAAVEIGAGLEGADEAVADLRLRGELPNLRAAREHAHASGDFDALVAIALAIDRGSYWRDLQEPWRWALELADDPRLVGHPRQVEVLGAAAEAAWLVGRLDRAEELARAGLAIGADAVWAGTADEQRGRCWNAAAVIALFRGEFRRGRDLYLRSARIDPRPGLLLAVAGLASTYAGERDEARALLERADAENERAGFPSARAWCRYVWGELLAGEDPAAAETAYLDAVALARDCGAGFIVGVAKVGLASLRTRAGDTAGAVEGYRVLLDYWRVSGNETQFWTTVRNVADLLSAHGEHAVAARLLAAAEGADAASTLTGVDADLAAARWARLAETIGPDELERVRALAATDDVGSMTHVAQEALRRLGAESDGGTTPNPLARHP